MSIRARIVPLMWKMFCFFVRKGLCLVRFIWMQRPDIPPQTYAPKQFSRPPTFSPLFLHGVGQSPIRLLPLTCTSTPLTYLHVRRQILHGRVTCDVTALFTLLACLEVNQYLLRPSVLFYRTDFDECRWPFV